MAALIHPTAVISKEAELHETVEVGPHVVIEGKVRIGAGCVIRAAACLTGPLTMGSGNIVFPHALLGESPQHHKYAGEPTSLEIGEGNIFREGVTIHRGTTHSWKTVVGNHNFFMVNSHVGHDCVIGNDCQLVNGALLGGHCALGDNAIVSGNAVVHQFVRIGRLAFLSGISGTGKDIPPFIIQQGIDNVVGVNVIGMRRAGMEAAEINAVRRAFKVLYTEGNVLPLALLKLENDFANYAAVQEIVAFLRDTSRGINQMRSREAA